MTAKLLLNVEEVAETLGVCRSVVYRLINDNEFPVVRIGKSLRVSHKVIEEWVERKNENYKE